jgi:alpha-glucosidase (family GH31 glycosyl hydrolase)
MSAPVRRARSGSIPALAIGVTALAAAGCGDDAGLAPAPPVVEAGPVSITTDPLEITITGPLGELRRERFVELGVVDGAPDLARYVDPRDPGGDAGDGVTWSAPARALGVDDDGWLVLDGGARLRLQPGDDDAHAVLTLDASAVPGAVLDRLVLPLEPGEPVHGFGESFGGADASGQVREAQFRVDLGSESGLNEAHVPVPLALWPGRGAGLFVADRRVGAFDLGAARPGDALATFGRPERGPRAFHLFVADAPVALVERYVALTARPAVPPRWALAPQQWRNVHDSSDQVRDDARAMRDLGIPGSVMWIDNPWQTGYNTFVVDEARFAGFDALMDELAALGYRVVFWSTPYLLDEPPTAPDFAEAADAGYFVRDGAGRVLEFPWKEGPVGLVDFTNPDATAWWQQRIARIVERGASGFKLDYGEDVVPELAGTALEMQLAAGSNAELHGIFARSYHEAYLDALPEGDGFLITRAGAWGEQDRNTAIWPGDLDNDFSVHGVDNGEGERNVGGLPAAIAGGLSLAVSGYPFYGSDIGGYRGGAPTTEALIRWSQYAALGTIMQLGGGGPSHNPWDATLYDPPALDVYREYARLHLDLNPYLWTLALAAGARGTPITVPARFAWPAAGCDDAMFTLGDAILVAPVVEPGATTRAATLPPGRWIDWWTGAATEVAGPAGLEVIADAPLTRLPMWRRADAFVPMFARAADTLLPATAPGVTSYADPAYGGELRLLLTPDGGAASTTLHDGALATGAADGATYALAFTPGEQYRVATFDLDVRAARAPAVASPATVTADGAPLPVVVDDAALRTCAGGCWLWEPAAGRLRIRVDAGAGATRTVVVE